MAVCGEQTGERNGNISPVGNSMTWSPANRQKDKVIQHLMLR